MRFIDADALRNIYEEQRDYLWALNKDFNKTAESEGYGVNWCINNLEKQPTADVRENVHGEWLIDEYNAEYCSACGRHPYNDGEYYVVGWYSDFCPHCGADMRKGETNE